MDWYFPGECFSRAIQFIRLHPKLPQAEYYYGECLMGGLHNHGWVEIGDVVFDGVLQDFYTKEGYYKAQIVKPWYRFDRQATMWIDRMSKRNADWSYRWDHVLDLPWSDYTTLPLITLEVAKAYWAKAHKNPKKPLGENHEHNAG
jgi:hypothetical protein